MNRITFVIFTFNEEKRIELTLRNFAGWGELLIIDNHSTDQTIEIARKYTNRIVLHRNAGHVDDAETYQVVCKHAPTDWVYRGFAGEAVPCALLRSMISIVSDESAAVVMIAKRNISYGVETKNWALGYHPRLARKRGISFDGLGIHSIGKIVVAPSQIRKLPKDNRHCIYQFRDYDVEATMRSFASYIKSDSVESHRRFEAKFSPIRQVLLPLYVFISSYLRRGAFLRGWPALFNAVWNGLYQFNRQVALWEIKHGYTLDSIRKQHEALRRAIVEEAEPGIAVADISCEKK